MNDNECVAFLQWALPRLGRRWEGYRKVRRRVCRKVSRHAATLDLLSLTGYREYLERTPDEWPVLDALVDVTISRFYRDRAVFDFLRDEALPALGERARAADTTTVRAWSAGCASGEEPYTLAIMGELGVPGSSDLDILATDIKPNVLQRAGRARCPHSAVRDLPSDWRVAAFRIADDELELRPRFRGTVAFAQHDIRDAPPAGPFDLILCRYQAFTYFDKAGQRATLRTFADVMEPGAVLVLGSRERIPDDEKRFTAWSRRLGVFRRTGEAGSSPA